MPQEDIKELKNKIIKGLALAYENMIEFKKQKNSKIIVPIDSKIVALNL